MATTALDALRPGVLVSVRGQRWIVGDVDPADASTLVTLQSVEDGRYGESLDVIWEVEPGREILPAGSLPDLDPAGFDHPERLAAFLDAVRWSAVTSADVKTLQSPFRSGVAVEDYQLEPVARAVDAPRVNLLLADDVGLGKTIEAGLVVQELLLRHRAKRILIICPAGLTLKWRDEMADKFGRDFTVIDSERCARVRRDYGSAANPFTIYPLAIVSLPWLRGQKAQRLLDEVLPPEGPSYPRTFDLLILDEAHHVAPAAPKQAYAVDSQQTKLLRRIAPHFTHRLFLSATPHNGHPTSFTALLEILDDQRFARGVSADKAAIADVVVRRLKRDIVNADGTERFPRREPGYLPVEYPDSEREIHALLTRFAELRRAKTASKRGRKAVDLITLLLKKRLFSSPAAFANTVEVYLETLAARGRLSEALTGDPTENEIPDWLEDFVDELAVLDDEAMAEAEHDAVVRTGPMQPSAEDSEVALLNRMLTWARGLEAKPDAKATQLLTYLEATCRPDGTHWLNERVVVFTEYRDTQRWLANLLRQTGLAGDRLAELHGGIDTDTREQLRLAFQADPTEHPVRILLATDAASEGIDLQRHCHRLVNYDIPFNPNKLEQRIGRIDRYGQTVAPDIRHFVGTGFSTAVDPMEADLEFLSRVFAKVVRMEADLGSVNAVLSDAVQKQMLGGGERIDVEQVGSAAPPPLPANRDVGDQVRKLRSQLDETIAALGITPDRVERVVSTALELARQQPLGEYLDDRGDPDGLYAVPTLTGSWARATDTLVPRLKSDTDESPTLLPITFDAALVRDRDDVVLAHLNHPLVAMSTRLLRAAVSNPAVGLQRVTAVIGDDPRLEDVLVGAYARFVVVGADGIRLHEEVLHAGGWMPESGRFRRLENLGVLGSLLDAALGEERPVPAAVWPRIAARWERTRAGVVQSVDWRAGQRLDSLERTLSTRQSDERKRLTGVLDQFAATLRDALARDADTDEDALFSAYEVSTTVEERAQFRRDRQTWQARLDALQVERDRELAAIDARYASRAHHVFPVALVIVVPRQEVTR